jgi:hypothetical protein
MANSWFRTGDSRLPRTSAYEWLGRLLFAKNPGGP